jgi:hypothetical protein
LEGANSQSFEIETTQACHFEAEGREIHYDNLLQSNVRVDFSLTLEMTCGLSS